MNSTVEIFPYILRARTPLNARHEGNSVAGVLVRRAGGHACLQAWEALGDAPLADHVASLAGGNPTGLASRAVNAAAVDAAARRAGRSLCEDLIIPPSHATLLGPPDADTMESWFDRGFDTFKVKLGRDWRQAMPAVLAAAAAHPGARWRFDFNSSITAGEALAWARSLPDKMLAATDFVEDPCPFTPCDWMDLEEATGLRIAADACCTEPPASGFIGICKPARDDAQAVLAAAMAIRRPMVVTSNMDHPLGVAWAACWAARFAAAGVHHGPAGLCTHLLFEPDRFSDHLVLAGNRMEAPAGTGLGFDDLLAALPWQRMGV
jgi:O-succinylbenzoate synthase